MIPSQNIRDHLSLPSMGLYLRKEEFILLSNKLSEVQNNTELKKKKKVKPLLNTSVRQSMEARVTLLSSGLPLPHLLSRMCYQNRRGMNICFNSDTKPESNSHS